MKPLFLFSLPRSGSTLLQRMLASHPEIATASEPWLLLPLLYMLKARGGWAEYSHQGLVRAVEDFCATLPNGQNDFRAELAELARRLYIKSAGGDVTYFLDKTPRYHLIVAEVVEMFPEARFIFLWRNPLAVAASIIETWGRGKWNLYAFRIDLYRGLENLINAYDRFESQACSVNYEALISKPHETIKEVHDYLKLDSDMVGSVKEFVSVSLKGRMGDPTGVLYHHNISHAPLDSWKRVFCNPLRKAWGRRYLDWIGRERLQRIGYDWQSLREQLDSIQNRSEHLGLDAIRMVGGGLWQAKEAMKWAQLGDVATQAKFMSARKQ